MIGSRDASFAKSLNREVSEDGWIFTRRLVLQPAGHEHVPRICKLLRDKSMARWVSPIRYPYPAADAHSFVQMAAAMRARSGPGDRAIMLRSNRSIMIGMVSCVRRGKGTGDHVLGYWMSGPYRRRGFAGEAARAMVEAAFEMGAPAILAEFLLGNHASRRLMERLGMRRTGMGWNRSRLLEKKRQRCNIGSQVRTGQNGGGARPWPSRF